MRIAYITAGAAGMFCGSCMRDNTLASALIAQGHDALLIPTYTPIRTDEADVSQPRVFFGGINVFLSGMVHQLRDRLQVPILGSLQGDDSFLELLPEPHRSKALELISQHCRQMQGFIATSRSYADFMSGYLRIPREKIHVVHPG